MAGRYAGLPAGSIPCPARSFDLACSRRQKTGHTMTAATLDSADDDTKPKSRDDLTSGSVFSGLRDLWLPMIGGVLAVKAIGLSDAYFIGQLGEEPLAAVSYTFPITMLLISLAIGLSSGASSVLS
ncbi:MAG TPA: hypothetical protein DDY27_02505, partial [Hyphomonadaceae bacterium]|nr:hypothetical protein [Hyphomonadaceae bacterium]